MTLIRILLSLLLSLSVTIFPIHAEPATSVLHRYHELNVKILKEKLLVAKRTSNVAYILSGSKRGKGVYVTSNKVLTAAHVIEPNEPLVVDNYEAVVSYINPEEDWAILTTTYPKDIELSITEECKPVFKEYSKGDSGIGVFSETGALCGILHGKNKQTNEYVIIELQKILKNKNFININK